MCGIVGFISRDEQSWKNAKTHFAHFALTLDTLRGGDSTGIISVRDEFDVHVQHTTAPGDQWVHTKTYQEFMDNDMWAMVGHNRAATAGSVKLENAHPFTFGEVTMVHNGTLAQKGRSLKAFDPELDVDSMNIAKALSEVPPEDAKKVLEQIDGSFTLVWVDRRTDTICMARNSERPLHFGFNSTKDIMWFMSDGSHLAAINTSFRRSGCRINTIYSMDRMKIMRWKKGSLVPEVEAFDPFVRPVVSHTTHGTWGWGDGRNRLETATKRWQRDVDKYHKRSSTGSGTGGTKTAVINQIRRAIPDGQLAELDGQFEIQPDVIVEFEPDMWMEMADKKCVVTGTFYHPEWGYSEWPMTLHNVPLVICTAYADRSWVVRTKGVTNIFDHYDGVKLAVLGEYHSSDVQSYFPDLTHNVNDDEDETGDSGLVLVGVDEELLDRGKAMSMLAAGCICCGTNISWEDKNETLVVNDGQDVMCGDCTVEWQKGLSA